MLNRKWSAGVIGCARIPIFGEGVRGGLSQRGVSKFEYTAQTGTSLRFYAGGANDERGRTTMDFSKNIWIAVSLGVVLAIGAPSTAGAQTPPGASIAEPYTPAKDAKDLKAVLFNWMWGQGMLKGHDERDMVATLEFQGKGTMQVDGQPCTLTRFRASTNTRPSVSGSVRGTRANGQSTQTSSGQRATPGRRCRRRRDRFQRKAK